MCVQATWIGLGASEQIIYSLSPDKGGMRVEGLAPGLTRNTSEMRSSCPTGKGGTLHTGSRAHARAHSCTHTCTVTLLPLLNGDYVWGGLGQGYKGCGGLVGHLKRRG